MNPTINDELAEREDEPHGRFYVRAPSINALRRALHRAPGGVKVMGRHDRETILCTHTMAEHSLGRHWPVIVSRLEKAGLRVEKAAGSGSSTGTTPVPAD
jgi:hypothetical protein